MQKIMKLCDCPVDICRADQPPEHCRFVMDPHDKMRAVVRETLGINCHFCAQPMGETDKTERLKSAITESRQEVERLRKALHDLRNVAHTKDGITLAAYIDGYLHPTKPADQNACQCLDSNGEPLNQCDERPR